MVIIRLLLVVWLLPTALTAQDRNLGAFTSAADVGAPAITGTTEFTPSAGEYRMTAAGANMWAKQDQFQFAWREMTGNFTVNATLRFLGEGNEHRKAGIMVRQSLDADATYGDVVVHGNGMTGLQWRTRKGEDTNTFNLPIEGPGTFTIRLVRTGVRIYFHRPERRRAQRDLPIPKCHFRTPCWSDCSSARMMPPSRTR